MTWLLADTTGVFGISIADLTALSQIGLTGGAILVIVLLLIGKLSPGYLIDRSEERNVKLQKALDDAASVNAAFPKVIADLTKTHEDIVSRQSSSHEREVAGLTGEIRRVQDMLTARQ